MSTHKKQGRMTVPGFTARKGGAPLVCLTAYTAPMARALDGAVDMLLVGDSVGMVLYGMQTTLAVDVDTMIRHGQAVMRGSETALVVVDMPFGSYQESPQQAFHNAARIIQETGCAAIKLEGGVEMADTVRYLTERGIPVMAHVGLMPQKVHATGGFRSQGRAEEARQAIRDDALAVTEAGAFSLLVEGIVQPLAAEITDMVAVPTIGIGASDVCDGQILVSEDVVGLFGAFTPKFVKRYADLLPVIEAAASAYADDVRARRFPADEHAYLIPQTDEG